MFAVTISTGSTTGTYTLTFTVTGQGKTHSVTATLTINPPATTPPPTTQPPTTTAAPGFDFSLVVSPSELSPGPGESATVAVMVQAVSGSGSVRLSVSGVPQDAEWSLSPEEVSVPGTAVLSLTAGSTAGSYSVLVVAEGGGVVRTATVSLEVRAASRCLVATAAYGSGLAGEVQLLREFRDCYVSRSRLGSSFVRAFNSFYYCWSPYVAGFIAGHTTARLLVRLWLYPLIQTLRTARWLSAMLPFGGELNVLLTGVYACLLLGALYLAPLLMALSAVTGRALKVEIKYLVIALTLAVLLAALSLATGLETLGMTSTSLIVILTMLVGGIAVRRVAGSIAGKAGIG